MNTCKGCGAATKLGKAHIIPESFFRGIRGGDGDLHQYSADSPGRRKRRPIGVYDKNILCPSCDNQLSAADQYGAQTLIQRESEIHSRIRNGRTEYCLPDVDAKQFRRFLAAVLWRASVSEMSMFAQVKLGRNETLAKSIAFGSLEPRDKDFAFFVTKFLPNTANGVVANPSLCSEGRAKFVRLILPGYAIHVKTCSRTLSAQLKRTQFNGIGILYMLGKDFREIPAFDDMKALAIAG